MESAATPSGVDLTRRHTYPVLALVLAVISVAGSTMGWELPGGGFVFGALPALAALVLGVQHLRESQRDRGKAWAAVIIAGAMLAMMLVWTVVESLS